MNEKKRPKIETERLRLRPFTLDDAPEVQRLVGDRDIASTTITIPHPYEDGMAEQWISTHQERFDKGEAVPFAITHGKQGYLIGSIGLHIAKEFDRADLGYWIGKPYWNQGYCTEAAQAVIQYGFEVLGLNRITANHITRNPASGRVMQKLGMKHEGYLRQHSKKWGNYDDVEVYRILRSEYTKHE
ncbi:MAG TPA: GNAT family N-acetyltransferase [Dehalococcoidia bacterium]|nr:GNAT family N-acetyltransferase [Dehalococcoidia bacterium]